MKKLIFAYQALCSTRCENRTGANVYNHSMSEDAGRTSSSREVGWECDLECECKAQAKEGMTAIAAQLQRCLTSDDVLLASDGHV